LDSGELTNLGKNFIECLPAARDVFDVSTFEPELHKLAQLFELDFRISWRLANLCANEEAVNHIASAWASSDICPMDIAIGTRIYPRAVLKGWRARRWLGVRRYVDAAQFAELLASEPYLHIVDPDASHFDVRAASGETDTLIDDLQAAIASHPDDVELWANLALALRKGAQLDAFVFMYFPEVVFGVFNAIEPAVRSSLQPTRLAAWLAPMLMRQDDQNFAPQPLGAR
jgi:hypothetical protein